MHALFIHGISSFEGTPLKICKIQPQDLLFLIVFINNHSHQIFYFLVVFIFLLAFTSADTTFHKNLENVKRKRKKFKN